MKALGDGFLYVLIRSAMILFSVLGQGSVGWAGRWLGRAYFTFDWKHRKIAIKNVQLASGMPKDPEEVRRFVRRVYEHVGIGSLETLFIPRGNLAGHVSLENTEALDRALARGRGVILVCPHLGNWEMAGLALCSAGYPLHVVARPMMNPHFDRYVTRVREGMGVKLIPTDESVWDRMAECLRNNGILALVSDQNARGNGVFVPFFGRPAWTVRTPAQLALKFGAPILVGKTYRTEPNRHRAIIAPPITIPEGVDGEEAIERITADIAGRFESFIRRHPDQWMWLHARWKKKPDEIRTPAGVAVQ